MFSSNRLKAISPQLKQALRPLLAAFLGATFLSAFLNVLMLTSPIFMMQLFDRVLTGRHLETLVMLTVIAVAAFMTYGGLDWARNQLMARTGTWLERNLAPVVLEASIQRALLVGSGSGQAMRDLSAIRQLVGGKALFPFLDAPWSLLFFTVLWLIHPWLGVFALASALVLFCLTALSELMTRRLNKDMQQDLVAAQLWADQAINESEAISALGMRGNLLTRYAAKQDKVHERLVSTGNRAEIFGATARSVRQMAQIGIMVLAAYLLLQEGLSPGVVIAASILLARSLVPLEMMLTQWQPFNNGVAALSRIVNLLATSQEEAGKTVPPPPKGRLRIAQLALRKPGGGHAFLLRDINLDVAEPQVIGIMGPSGSGKTCLCRALAGVARPDIGEVRLDGARLDQWPADELGPYIGYMPQDVGLPPATVAETIARLMPEPDMDKVYAAAKEVEAHEFILQLPQGYDTLIGSGGVPLSGGQRQRIGLARALYGDPVLIILDEPDAHLDAAASEILARVVQRVKRRGGIVLLVSHRPPILQATDRIVVMGGGSVVHEGPSAQVLHQLQAQQAQRREAANKASVRYEIA